MVSKTELEALRQAYTDLPWPAWCDSAARGRPATHYPLGAGAEARAPVIAPNPCVALPPANGQLTTS